MERKPITCPETGHLEEIDLERTSRGILIDGCSRFEPRSAVACNRECARRMDRREQLAAHDKSERILIVYASTHGATKLIAERLGDLLMQDGFAVELADVHDAPPPPVDYDAVVLGSRVHWGRHAHELHEYIRMHRAELAAMPSFLFSVSARARLDGLAPADAVVEHTRRATGWAPTMWAAFAGSVPYTRYLPPLRWLAKHAFGRRAGAYDTRRDHELTNWADVRAFALRIADQIPEAALYAP